MGTVDFPKNNKTARPQAKNAQLPAGTGGNRQDALEQIFREQSVRFSNRLGAVLPAEAAPRLDEKVYKYISQNYRSISGSFPVLDDLISHDSGAYAAKNTSAKNTAVQITAMLESSGGADRFNTGEIEKSTRQVVSDLEAHTNAMLRRKAGIGSVVDSHKANSVAACVFKDNAKKPKTVTDLRLAINIPETELIDPETRFKAGAGYLVKEIICKSLLENIDREINREDDAGVLDNLLNKRQEINSADMDIYLENIDRNEEIEEIRDKGFSAASNLIVSILNAVNLDCQSLENLKDRRELLIREYEDADDAVLPDEHYQIKLRYIGKAQLLEERESYKERLKSLLGETQRLWDLLEVIYQDSKSVFKVSDFEDLVKKNKSRIIELIKNKTPFSDAPKNIDAPHPKAAPQGEKEKIRAMLAALEERIKNISGNMYPAERQISEDKLSALKNEFSCIENGINPCNLQPGILIDIDLTSIKRKRTTLDSMAAALGCFLGNVSDCFLTD